MKKFAYFSDLLFTFSVSGIFTLLFFRFLGIRLWLSFPLALVCGALTALAVGAIASYRRKNLFLKRSDETEKAKLLLHLSLLSDAEKTEYFLDLLSTAQEPANRFGRLRIFTKTEFYFLKFTLAPLSADEIPNLARLKTGKKKILLCSQIEEQALTLCSRLGIEVRTGEWVYTALKKANALPERYLGDIPKPKKGRRKLWFSRKNAKRFFVSGVLVLLLARLTPFSYYYLLFGVLLLGASVFTRIFGYE